MIKFFILLLASASLSFGAIEAKVSSERYRFDQEWTDLKETVEYLYKGAYTQFTLKNNLYYGAIGTATTYYAFEEDKRISDHQRNKELRKIYDVTGDLGILFSFPIVHLGTYYYGRHKKNNHAVQFAKEYMATMYLTLAETGIISYLPGHERPNKEGQSKWETAFRGANSFPSGHIVPYSTLFFKTLQFYGPYWSLIPGTLTVWSSLQRVREGRHFMSDVVGAFWLSAMASEGVRAAAKYKKNHPFYKMVFERNLRISAIKYQNIYGPAIVFNL